MRRQWATIVFCGAWMGVLVLALKAGATAFGVTPEQIVSLTMTFYFGVWGLVFFVGHPGRGPRELPRAGD